MDRVAICRDRRVAHRAVLVRNIVRLDDALRTAFYRLVVGVVRVLDIERDIPHAVAVLLDVLGRRMIRMHRRRQDEIDIHLTHQVTRHVPLARLEPAI